MAPILPGVLLAASSYKVCPLWKCCGCVCHSRVSEQAEVCVKRFYWHGPNNELVHLVSYNPNYNEIVFPAAKII